MDLTGSLSLSRNVVEKKVYFLQMDIDGVLVDLSVVSQLKDHDKLGVNNLPGKQELVIFSGKAWLQGTYRWYYGSNRSDVVEYLQVLVKRVERHAELFSEPVTEKTRVLRENLKKYTISSLEGLGHLQNTYSSDNHMVAQIGLITEKLSECSKQIKTE